MTIKITIQEALDKTDFDKFCEMVGLNPYCISEGLATGEESYELTLEQAKELNLFKD